MRRTKREHGVDFLGAVAHVTKHHAQTVREEAHELFAMIAHARNARFDFPGRVDEVAKRQGEALFHEHAKNAERMAAKRERILFTRRHLTDAEEARERFHLVRERDGKAHRRRGERIARVAGLIVFADGEGHVVGFAVVTGVVFAHDPLQFGEFAHHQRAKVGLGEHGRAFGVRRVGADERGEAPGHRLDAQHAFGLIAELVVVDDVLQAFHAALKRLQTVLVVEELGVGKTGADDAGVPRRDRLAAVAGDELRDEEEAVHELPVGVAKREVALVELHREDEAFFRNLKEFLFEAAFVDDRPFGQGRDFFEQVFGHDDGAARLVAGFRKKLAKEFAALFKVGHHEGGLHRVRIGVGGSDFDGVGRHEAVAHRHAAGVEAEELDGDDVFAQERDEVLDGAHEGDRRFAVGELIGHDLRNREFLDGGVKRRLKARGEFHARTHAFEDELFVLAVLNALQGRDVALNAERGHLLREGGRRFAFGGQTHAHRDELLRKGFVGALFEHVRDAHGQAARRTVGGHDAFLGQEMLLPEVFGNAVGKGARKLQKSLRREFFRLEFNKQILHFVSSSASVSLLQHREAEAFARVVVALRHGARDVADAGDVRGAFRHGDRSVRVEQIEGVTGLEHHFVSGQGQVEIHQALGFGFEIVELLQKLRAVGGFEVVVRLFDFVLMEDVAVGENAFGPVGILPGREDQVEDVVAVLQIHRQAFETVGDFTRDRLAFETAHLLEVGELRHFHAVHPDFPTETPGAERRVFPVVFDEADVVDRRVDAEGAQRAEVEVHDVRGRGLEHDLILMVLVQAVGIFAVAGILRTARGLNVRGAPRFGTERAQERGGVRRTGTHLQVNRLQERTALAIPIFLQAQDDFLKSDHGETAATCAAPLRLVF